MAAQVHDEMPAEGSRRRLLRPFVATALARAPGPELVTSMIELTGRDDLSAREWAEVAAGWKQVIAFGHAGQMVAIAGLDRALSSDRTAARPGRTDPVRPAADELAPVLGIAPRAASALVALTRRVEDHLPAAADAMAEGRMDMAQLRVVDRVVRDLPTATAAMVEAAAVRLAPRRTAQQLEADLRTEAARLDPDHASAAVARGVAERDVTLRPSPLPGCRRLVADIPLVQATAAWLALNGCARNAKKAGVRPDGSPEDRTLAQVRADFLVALLTGQADAQNGAVPTPEQLAHLAEVQVVVAADTLRGSTELPGYVPGVGPVDPATVRDVAARTKLRRLVADPDTGTLLRRGDRVLTPAGGTVSRGFRSSPTPIDLDPRLQSILHDPPEPPRRDDATRYRPSRRLRAHVQTRDATCIGPACQHPAAGTQVDHNINHGQRDEHGVLGRTVENNLANLCERIHNAKTHGDWHLEQTSPGAFRWTSATGRTYEVRARPLVPGWRHRHERGRGCGRPPPGPGRACH